jgi:hypothetical protein
VHECRRRCDLELVSTHRLRTLVPAAHAIVIAMGGVQVLPGCCILHQNYERYIRVIFMLSYVATIQPKEEGRKTSPLVVWSLRTGMMKNTGVFFIIWLYGVYVRSIFHLLVVWSVRTGMMKNTEVFFIR